MPQVSLQAARVVSRVGQRVTASVSEHVGVRFDAKVSLHRGALYHAREARCSQWGRRAPIRTRTGMPGFRDSAGGALATHDR